jgi:hypothetical protein
LANDPKQLASALRQAARLQPGERLYGIVDGAQDLSLAYEAKLQYRQQITSLFEGEMAEGAANVAPYLVPIDPSSAYLENWAARWGRNAGILLTTTADLEPLRPHLRKVFIAQDEQGQEFFFRFYDPRVLRAYLPTCTHDELTMFWGPIHCFLVEDSKGAGLLRWSVGPAGLVTETVALADPEVAKRAG